MGVNEETHSDRVPDNHTDAPPQIGKTLGKYEIKETLGQGGMGIVYRAYDPLIEREVAIKVLPPDLAGDRTALPRFLAEAKAAGRLHHPNVVAIYDIGQTGNSCYLVMELVTGGSVEEGLSRQGAFSVLNATRILEDACRGIAAAHAVGLVHRDIKPANLIRAADGSIKITDFGLAKSNSSRNQQMTQAGIVVGTPYFMSPEQCEAQPVDARSDIYSLGATYYSLLTGKNPYEDSSSVVQLMFAHCHAEIPDPRLIDSSIPAACAAIICKAMAKAPNERYQSAHQMLADLERVSGTLSGAFSARPSGLSGNSKRLQPANMRVEQPHWKWHFSPVWKWGACLVAGISFAGWFWQFNVAKHPAPQAAVLRTIVSKSDPIKVGILHSMSGTMALSETVVVDATMLAIEEINQAGGLLGRRIQPVVADGRSEAATFVVEARRLINEEKVCTVFGCWTSASRKAIKPVFEEADHLLVYPLQYEGLEESPNIIYMGAAPNQQIIPAVEWAINSLNKKRFYLLGSDYVFPRAANAIVRDHLMNLGAEVVGESYLRLGSQAVDSVISDILRVKPEMIINTINGDSNIAFFRALRLTGITPSLMPSLSFSLSEQELRSLSIADMEGDFAAWTYFQSVNSQENARFVKRFQDQYPQRVISDPMEAAYVGVKLWARAVSRAKSLEPDKIRRAMLNQRCDAPGGPTRIDPDTQHCYKTPRVGKIGKDGQFSIVWAADEPVAPQPFPVTRSTAEWKGFLNDLKQNWKGNWSAP